MCVPEDAAPGEHAGAVRLMDATHRIAEVPVRLRVWPFALPRTGSFVAAFGLPTRVGTRALGRPDDPAIARDLAAAALRHRLTPYILSADAPDGDCTAKRCALDWTRYDAEVGPVLDGTLVSGVRGGFAEVRIPARVWGGPELDLAATLRAWRRHFEERGWADRLWLYTLDEPGPAQLPELRRRARLARAASIRVFATVVPLPELAGAVDDFAPNLALVVDGGARPGQVTWSYASCLSHGCDELPGEGPRRRAMLREFAGWPGYEIDRPGTAARAVPLLGVRRGLKGELYYDMLQAWTGDPWSDVRAFAGNGDGTLLYPGRPDGARRDAAVPGRVDPAQDRAGRARGRGARRAGAGRGRGAARGPAARAARAVGARLGAAARAVAARAARARRRARAARPAGGAVTGAPP